VGGARTVAAIVSWARAAHRFARGIHPNDAGYDVLAQLFRDAIIGR
jgi:hypothetical protein